MSQRDWDQAALINAAYDVHQGDPEFGYRLITDELPGLALQASENRVARLCSSQQVFNSFGKKRGLCDRPGPAVHDDLVKRKFTAEAARARFLAAAYIEPVRSDGVAARRAAIE